MKANEAIKLIISGKDLSFAEIRDANAALKSAGLEDTADFARLTAIANKKIPSIKDNLFQMSLEEAMAAAEVSKEFTPKDKREAEDFEKSLAEIESRIAELKKDSAKDNNKDKKEVIIDETPNDDKKENTEKKIPDQTPYDLNAEINDISAEELNRNYAHLAMYADAANPLDENNTFFASTRDGLDILDVKDENNQTVDIRDEIIETAKMQSIAELITSKEKISPDDFNNRLKENIDILLFSIINVDRAAELAKTGNTAGMRQEFSTMVDKFVAGGKKSKIEVKLDNAIAVLTVKSEQLNRFGAKLKGKFNNIPAVSAFNNRLGKLDEKLNKKFGKKYETTKAVVKGISGIVTDIGLATLAGAMGPIGMGIYATYTFNRNVVPFLAAYKEESRKTGIRFKDYTKAHKTDASLAGLYTVSSFLTAGVGVAVAAHNVTTNAGATLADSFTKFASHGKVAAGLGAIAVKQGADIKNAYENGDSNDLHNAVGKAALSLLLFGVMAEGRNAYDLVAHGAVAGAGIDSADGTPHTVINNTTNNYYNDNSHNGDIINNCCPPENCPDCEPYEVAPTPTPAPVTPAPVTPAPVTPAPVTPAPVTPAPVTPAPVTPAPVTPAFKEAPMINLGDMKDYDIELSPVETTASIPAAPVEAPMINLGDMKDYDVELSPVEIPSSTLANDISTQDTVSGMLKDYENRGIQERNGLFYEQAPAQTLSSEAPTRVLANDVTQYNTTTEELLGNVGKGIVETDGLFYDANLSTDSVIHQNLDTLNKELQDYSQKLEIGKDVNLQPKSFENPEQLKQFLDSQRGRK